jgi:hypothetical protein
MSNLTQLDRRSTSEPRRPTGTDLVLEELRAIRDEMSALRSEFSEFAGVLLNAKLPYGKADDRWGRRR